MFGVLDTNGNGNRCGSKVLRQTMQEARFPPRLLLHGHVHEAAGVTRWSRGVIVSNAATTQRVLEVKV
jgi:Icc-related predicted phosphoesterase